MPVPENMTERFVCRAWREMWTLEQFSTNVAYLRPGQHGRERDQLAKILLRYAGLDDDATFMKYFRHCASTRVVSTCALLEAMVGYENFDALQRTTEILDAACLCVDLAQCNTEQEEESCIALALAMLKLCEWYLKILCYCVESQSESTRTLSRHVCLCLDKAAASNFLKFSLQVAVQEDRELYGSITARSDYLLEMVEHCEDPELRCNVLEALKVARRLISSACEPYKCVDSLADYWPSAAVSLSIIFANIQYMIGVDDMVTAIVTLKEVQANSWSNVIRDILHGAFLLLHDNTSTSPPSVANSFIYLRLPRIFYKLCRVHMSHQSLIDGLKAFAAVQSILNASDLKVRCNTLHFLLNVIGDMEMISEMDKEEILQIRQRQRGYLDTYPSESQPTINLVLKAEPTLQSILKVLDGENLQMPDRLSQMLNPLMSGKSLLYIVAAANATDQISSLANKLIRINEHYRAGTENSDCEVFDLSFLLLHRLSQYYSVKFWLKNNDAYLCYWCFRTANQLVRNVHTPEDGDILASLRNFDPMQTADILLRLRRGHPGWISLKSWDSLLAQVPALGDMIVEEAKRNTITTEELKHIFSGFIRVNVNGVHWMGSPLLCLAQYLALRADEASNVVAEKLSAFLDSILTMDVERNKLVTDRMTFMVNSARRFLISFVSTEEQPLPPFNWFGIGRMLARQFLAAPEDHFPTISKPENIPYLLANSLRLGSVTSALVTRIVVSTELDQYETWMSNLIEALQRVNTCWGINAWCQISLSLCFVNPKECAIRLISYLESFVVLTRRDLFYVAPRGNRLASFLVQLYVVAMRFSNGYSEVGAGADPSIAYSEVNMQKNAAFQSLQQLYKLFDESRDGFLYPFNNFVTMFLTSLAIRSSPEAVIMKREVPLELITFLLRADPHSLPIGTVMSLFSTDRPKERRRIMQLICLVRKMGGV